jgi:SAM-dependent methyltransferase
MALGRFDEFRFYRFGLALGVRNVWQNGAALGWKKTIGKIAQPINSPTRFSEYWYFEERIRECFKAAHPARTLRILDVGSPKTMGLYIAVRYDAAIDLTDISPQNLDEYRVLWEVLRARAKGKALFAAKDARALEYPDAVFDIVYAMSVIEHVEGQTGDTAAIHEAMRVLRPGGRLVVSVPFGRRYVEQSRIGLAGAVTRTGDRTPHFFQRIYDAPSARARLIEPAMGLGLSHVTCTSVWRENVAAIRLLGAAGEQVRGLLGWANPLVSILVNRSDSEFRTGNDDRYGTMFSERDIYGDLMFSGRKL